MSHDQYHDHRDQDHGPHRHGASGANLALALTLTLGYAAVEAVGGWLAGSLALLGDAGHMLTDGLALGLAALAGWLASRPASRRHSYGLGRVELLTALINALLMLAIVTSICVAAIDRLIDPAPVLGETVTLIALIGLMVNLLVAWILSRGHHNINVRGALLHVMGDILGSVAALISGVAITLTGWTPIDPILSLVIAALILFSAVNLLRHAMHLLLDGVPPRLDLAEVGEALATLEGVRGVHDLHIWQISGERVALSAHLMLDDINRWEHLLKQAHELLGHRFGIDHTTLQPEVTLPAGGLYQIQDRNGK